MVAVMVEFCFFLNIISVSNLAHEERKHNNGVSNAGFCIEIYYIIDKVDFVLYQDWMNKIK